MRIGECCKDQSRVILAFVSEILASVAVCYGFLFSTATWSLKRHKKMTGFAPKPLFLMVAIGGLEPPTPGL